MNNYDNITTKSERRWFHLLVDCAKPGEAINQLDESEFIELNNDPNYKDKVEYREFNERIDRFCFLGKMVIKIKN